MANRTSLSSDFQSWLTSQDYSSQDPQMAQLRGIAVQEPLSYPGLGTTVLEDTVRCWRPFLLVWGCQWRWRHSVNFPLSIFSLFRKTIMLTFQIVTFCSCIKTYTSIFSVRSIYFSRNFLVKATVLKVISNHSFFV